MSRYVNEDANNPEAEGCPGCGWQRCRCDDPDETAASRDHERSYFSDRAEDRGAA